MGEALRQRIKQDRFASSAQEAALNLLVAAGHLLGNLDRVCAEFGITHTQYNALRILRGALPNGYSRCEIGSRLLDRAPDVTRLIDRLERQGLAERGRSERDRRLSITRITEKGLALLEQIQPGIDAVTREFAARVPERDQRELSRICEAVYAADEHAAPAPKARQGAATKR